MHRRVGNIFGISQITHNSARLNAINANRNVLIQGMRVVDIPGVEELGILEVGEDGIPRFSRQRRRGIF